MKRAIDDFLPLAPATLHILLSMAGDKMYGYAIMQEVARQSEGRYKLGPGTLYDNLQRLMKQGWSRKSPAAPKKTPPAAAITASPASDAACSPPKSTASARW